MTMENVPPGQLDDAAKRKALSLGTIASGSGVALLLVFVLQNRAKVPMKFLWWEFTWPSWLLVLVSAVVGGLIWIGLGILRRVKRRRARRADRRD